MSCPNESFRLTLTPETEDAAAIVDASIEDAEQAAPSTALILVHGYGDSGANQPAVEIAIQKQLPGSDGRVADISSRQLRRHPVQTVREALEIGRSGLLTKLAAHLAINACLANAGSENTTVDVISPTLGRPTDHLPEGVSLFEGGLDVRAHEVLGSIMGWARALKNENGVIIPPEKIILAGHSLGAPTICALYRLLEQSEDNFGFSDDDKTVFLAVQNMFIGSTTKDDKKPQVTTVLINPGIDPAHSLFLLQRAIGDIADKRLGSGKWLKKSIIPPLFKAIGHGTVEQVNEVMGETERSIGQRLFTLATMTPRLLRVCKYTLRLAAVMHEAGEVIGKTAFVDYLAMQKYFERSDETAENDAADTLLVISNQNDQIFPSGAVQSQLFDNAELFSRKLRAITEARLSHAYRGIRRSLRDSTESQIGEARFRRLRAAKALGGIAAQATLQKMRRGNTCEAEPILIPDIQARHIEMEGGSHTSIGSDVEAKKAAQHTTLA